MKQLSPHPNIVQLHAVKELKNGSVTEVTLLLPLTA